MQWSDFYDAFWDWSDSTRRTRISSLENIGPGDEVVDAVLEIEDEKIRAQLIRKAMKLGAKFSHDDFENLEDEIPAEVYHTLAAYTGISEDDLYFDEANMTWDDFEGSYSDWNDKLLAKRIGKLNDFGDPEAVCDVIQAMTSSELEDALYERAIKRGVKFTQEQLEAMGHVELQLKNALDNFITDEQIEQVKQDVEILTSRLDEQYPTPTPEQQRKEEAKGVLGFLWAIIAAILGVFAVLLSVIFGLSKKYDRGNHGHRSSWGKARKSFSKKKGRYCDGDCANCPPHYGYRYGRWYYGHGHQWGCERGGDGGRKGLTSRD